MSIQLSSIMAMFFVHKGRKLENRQFLAKMHQIAPNCISNSKIFPGVPHPWGGGHFSTGHFSFGSQSRCL